MTNYKILFQYDGTSYNGFQKQGNTHNTIQEKLENILEKMCGVPVEIHASGRTDAGVHAKGQVANFHIDNSLIPDMTPLDIMNYINNYLPKDITILNIEIVPPRFHSRLNAISKTYVYHIDLNPKADVFRQRYSLSHPQPLDINAMKQATTLLVGTHDFIAFSSLKKTKKSTIRTISDISLDLEDGELLITYTGNGFLYNMVRILTGTLIYVGEGKLKPDDISQIFSQNNKSLTGGIAPSKGLFLEKVRY